MKTDIHPTYYKTAEIQCACKEVFRGGATKEKIPVEICSACHPFYTGKEKLVDAAGRVEKFRARAAQAKVSAKKTPTKKKKK